ncbi:hypothetical protein LZ31DRAFT_594779 [Colletotrichum somersetense]|nr:hypothetical protein LZ31DRAFT_594779 [Colletotrichum somersetense]
MASLPVVSKSKTKKASAPGGTKQKRKAAATSPAQVDNRIEPLAILSSHDSTWRQGSDSDEEYQPRPKRPRKANPTKPQMKKSIDSLQPSLPKADPIPKPASQLQTGTAGTLQPVKRGRGRPRKHPRPQDLVTQPTQNQLSTPQTSADNYNTQVSVKTFSGTSKGDHPASVPDSDTGKEAGCQAFTGGLTVAPIPSVASTSASAMADSSPQYYSHGFQPYNAPHVTDPELDLPQTLANVSRDVVTRPRPNSYEEFWECHQNISKTARQGRDSSYPIPEIAALSFAPSGPETTLSAEAAFSPVAGQVRSDIRQTPQAATQCASGIQKRLQG